MTALETLREELKKVRCQWRTPYSKIEGPILDAMETYRRDALEEVEAYVKHLGSLHFEMGHKVTRAIRKKIALLKKPL